MSLREIPVPGWSGGDPVYDDQGGVIEMARMGAWFEQDPRTPETPMQALMEAAPGNEPVESKRELQLFREAMADCMTALGPKHRFVIDLHDSERLSFAQMGDLLGVSKSQADRDYKAAIAALRPLTASLPIIYERINLQPSTWNEAANHAVNTLRIRAATSLIAPFDVSIERGKQILAGGWEESGGPLTDCLESLGASAFSSLLAAYDAPALVDLCTDLLVERHHKYGEGNILEFREYGLLVRMSDKVARIKNSGGVDFDDEAALDPYMDLIGYGAIAVMLARNTFHLPLIKENK